MAGLQIHHLLGIAGVLLVVLSLALYFSQKSKGKLVTTAGGALGGLLLGAGVGMWVTIQQGYDWKLPDPEAYLQDRGKSMGFGPKPQGEPSEGLMNATWEEKADFFRMRRPDEKPKPKPAPTKSKDKPAPPNSKNTS